MTGNFTATATLRFLGQGNEHRKAGIMIRQSLDTDATYADVVIHGNGMAALQWRNRQGEDTNTFDLPIDGQGTFTLKLVRTGVRVYLYVARNGAAVKEIAHTEVSFQGAGPARPGRLLARRQRIRHGDLLRRLGRGAAATAVQGALTAPVRIWCGASRRAIRRRGLLRDRAVPGVAAAVPARAAG